MNFLFIVTLVFLAIAFYMLFIKYKIHCNIVEGLAEDSLKAQIYEIAADNDAKIDDDNKLTAIQNLLYVSTDASKNSLDPIKNQVEFKNATKDFLKLPPEERAAQKDSVPSNIANNSVLLPLWTGFMNSLSDQTAPEYTYVEKIHNIVNDKNKLSSEKIASIKELSYVPPVKTPIRTPTFAGTARKYVNKIPGLFKRKKRK